MKYTVWVCSADGRGAHHVSSHETDSIDEAKRGAIDETLSEWGRPEAAAATLHVLGVCVGDVTLVEWDESIFGDD